MRLTTYLILRGWNPLDADYMLWNRPNEPEPVSFWWAAEKEHILIPHCWDRDTLACKFCGMTQFRVFIKEESAQCMGVPDAKAFQDSADHDKLKDRLRRALGGEEGLVWDSKND